MVEVIDDPLSDLVRRESNTTEVTGSVESSCKDDRIDQFGTMHIADKVSSSVLLGLEDWPRKDLVQAWRWVVVNCGIGRRFGGDRWIVDGNWIEMSERWLGKEPCTMHMRCSHVLSAVAGGKEDTIYDEVIIAFIHDDNLDLPAFPIVDPQPQLPHSGPLTSSTVPIGLLGPAPLEEPLPPDPGPLVPALFVEVVLGILEDAHLGRVWYEFGWLRVLN
jgi:hypothetical protein